MEIMDIVAVVTLAAVVLVSILLKRHTKKKLSEIDGMGQVKTASESDEIARF